MSEFIALIHTKVNRPNQLWHDPLQFILKAILLPSMSGRWKGRYWMYRILLLKKAKVNIDRSITGGKWVHIFRTEKNTREFPLYYRNTAKRHGTSITRVVNSQLSVQTFRVINSLTAITQNLSVPPTNYNISWVWFFFREIIIKQKEINVW